MIDRQLLDDHAAHAHADDLGRCDAERVEYRDGVVSHVREPVRDDGVATVSDGGDDVGDAWREVVELARETDIAVVEADHEESLFDESIAQRHVVVDALTAEAVDQ